MSVSPERFQTLIGKSSDAIFLVHSEGQVLYANASTATVFGYQPEELLGRNGLDLIHPQDQDPSVHNRLQARVQQKDGHWLWVESTACNLLDEPHAGAIVINYREIAIRRAQEEERQRLAEELARSNAELEAFAHTVAHDLREPLRTISAFTELLVQKAQLDETDKHIARYIVDGVRRMSTLLNDLLASATRGSEESFGPVRLESAATQAMENLKEALDSSGAAITMDPLPTIKGNECDLIRLFQNLIGNAVKYRSKQALEIHITAGRCGPDWVVRIRDNGIGIAKEHHRRVFGLFTRLHGGQIPGTGIGLALCKKIVEGFGGAIWVESEPGAGATFCFTAAIEPPVELAVS